MGILDGPMEYHHSPHGPLALLDMNFPILRPSYKWDYNDIYIYNLIYRSYVIPFVTVSWAIPSGKHTKNYGKSPFKNLVNQLFL